MFLLFFFLSFTIITIEGSDYRTNKGLTIRKVMGGGGVYFFNLYEYFFKFFACVDNFFNIYLGKTRGQHQLISTVNRLLERSAEEW